MEITKKHWTIIGIVIGALAIYYFFIRKTKMSVESGYADKGRDNEPVKCIREYTTDGTAYTITNKPCWDNAKVVTSNTTISTN